MKNALDQLYAQEMSRSDFLRYIGLVLMGLFGITTFLRLVLHTDATGIHATNFGYGGSTYGGVSLKKG